MANSKSPKKSNWIITAILFVAIALIGILAYAMLTTSGILTTPGSTQSTVFISIDRPAQGDNLDLTWSVNISGQAGGLLESELVVQAQDAAGNILAQEITTINSPESNPGGSGSWSVNLSINAPNGSQGQIVAFFPSPIDGSKLAEARVMVGYGESPFKRDLVSVEDHLWKLVTLNERPPIDNTLLTIEFESFQAAGFGGCNNFRSSYERSGTALNFGFVTSTAKECELPIGAIAQESAYFNAIEQISRFEIENTQFSLIDNSGVERLVYDAVVMGTIHGPEDVQFPEDGVVYIHLIDSTLTATEPMVIAVQEIREVPQFPATFSLVYNPKQIIDDHAYVIEVNIEDGLGNLLFINPDVVRVITAGNPSLVNINIGSPPQ